MRDEIVQALQAGKLSTTEIADKIGRFSWDLAYPLKLLARDGIVRRLGRDKTKGRTAPPMMWELVT